MSYRKSTSRLIYSGANIFFLVLIPILGFLTVWSYCNLDQQVFSLLSQKPIHWDNNFFVEAFTYLGKVYTLIWLLLVWFLSTGQRRPVLIAFLALIITFLMVMPLKVGVGRPRPYEVVKASSKTEQQQIGRHTSFPSGDAAAVCAVAAAITPFVMRPAAFLFFAVCAGIALLRVTAMAHYPSDVFAGAAIGCFAGWLAIQIDRRFAKAPLQPHRFNLDKRSALFGVIIIPLIFGLSEGTGDLLIFLATYGLLVTFVFAVVKGRRVLKLVRTRVIPHVVKKVFNSNRFDVVLNFLRKRRTLTFKIVFLVIMVENILKGERPNELWPPANTSVMAVIALFLILAGTSIRFWARGHFVKGRLFNTGPYAMVRHPLYLGSFLIMLGVLFQLGDKLFNFAVSMPIFFIFYSATIIYEEKSLKRRFGTEWELYCAKVPAIFPSIRNWPRGKCANKWSWSTYLATPETWATLLFLCLPFLIEVIEDVVFESMLGI